MTGLLFGVLAAITPAGDVVYTGEKSEAQISPSVSAPGPSELDPGIGGSYPGLDVTDRVRQVHPGTPVDVNLRLQPVETFPTLEESLSVVLPPGTTERMSELPQPYVSDPYVGARDSPIIVIQPLSTFTPAPKVVTPRYDQPVGTVRGRFIR